MFRDLKETQDQSVELEISGNMWKLRHQGRPPPSAAASGSGCVFVEPGVRLSLMSHTRKSNSTHTQIFTSKYMLGNLMKRDVLRNHDPPFFGDGTNPTAVPTSNQNNHFMYCHVFCALVWFTV